MSAVPVRNHDKTFNEPPAGQTKGYYSAHWVNVIPAVTSVGPQGIINCLKFVCIMFYCFVLLFSLINVAKSKTPNNSAKSLFPLFVKIAMRQSLPPILYYVYRSYSFQEDDYWRRFCWQLSGNVQNLKFPLNRKCFRIRFRFYFIPTKLVFNSYDTRFKTNMPRIVYLSISVEN